MRIITRQDIQEHGHRTLADVLNGVRGLYVTSDRAYNFLGIRGVNRLGDFGGRTLLNINGHRVNEPIYDSSFFGYEFPLDVDLIERVEVIRGPGSSLYGNNAFFGIINMVNNAKQALEARSEGRRLTLRIAQGQGERVRVEVSDNGMGIPAENLARIFNHGFTTKKTGHGFGLHSGANAAKEMGGNLSVRSDGPGTGATFILELPLGQVAAQPSSPSADHCQDEVPRAA